MRLQGQCLHLLSAKVKWTWENTYRDSDCECGFAFHRPPSPFIHLVTCMHPNLNTPLLLGGFDGLPTSQGVKVTADDLADLVKSLGLDDANTQDLIGGLDFSLPAAKSDRVAPEEKHQPQTTPSKPASPPHHGDHGALGDDLDEGDSEDVPDGSEPESEVSEVGELPPAPRLKPGVLARKRTDERPLTSPLTPTSSASSSFPGSSSPPKMVQPLKSRSSVISPSQPPTTPK